MNIRNCRTCGSIFNYVSGPILCQVCREELEEKFQKAKEYIRENPGATIPQVSKACDVEPGQIRQWLREERLEITESSSIYLNCEGCGANIRSGRYCDKCKAKVTNDLRNVIKQNKPAAPQPKKQESTSAKMRFL